MNTKPKRVFIWFVAIGAVLIALIVWFWKRPSDTKPPPDIVVSNAETPSLTNGAATGTHEQAGASKLNAPLAPQNPVSNPPVQPKAQQAKEGLAALNDEDVVFFGKVTDQFGSPVGSASVSGVIQVNNGVREGTDRLSLTTDSEGIFIVSGHKGKNLGITVKKTGYVMATTNTSFVYSRLWPE